MITLHRSTLAGLHHDDPTPTSVRAALQRAIELEHATIPVYLYAYFSLDPDVNGDAAAILRSVVVEEMLHMVLAANVLNALGGAPTISHRRFIPTYPGHLPSGVEGQLRLHLRPYSADQLEAFIEIEEPRDPVDYEAHAALVEVPSVTIGEFYLTIANAITRLPPACSPRPRATRSARTWCSVRSPSSTLRAPSRHSRPLLNRARGPRPPRWRSTTRTGTTTSPTSTD